jgi:hypothetical protein
MRSFLSLKCKSVCSIALLIAIVLSACNTNPIGTAAPTVPAPQLQAWNQLDTRWGAYLPEREWGNPREGSNGDGWAIDWLGAISKQYKLGEDGIAGLSDDQGEMQFSWAFWDGQQRVITERLNGATNPQGQHGETIYEDRVFHESTPTHSYLRYTYRYPYDNPQFEIEVTYAKLDSRTLDAQVNIKKIGDATRLYLLPKAWFHTGGAVTRVNTTTLDLAGSQSQLVVLVDQAPSHWQLTQNVDIQKAAFNLALTSKQALTDQGTGNLGMFEFDLDFSSVPSLTLKFSIAEAKTIEDARANAGDALLRFDQVVSLRQSEAQSIYRSDVTQHQDVYQAALQNLLWNEMFYRYDGSFEPVWNGKLNFQHVMIMPDKWEFPWLAGWDTGFQSVAAIHADVNLSKEQLRLILGDGWQTVTGHVPCTEWTAITECPAVFGWAAWQIYQADGDKNFLNEIYPRLEKHYQYWMRAIQVGKSNLYAGGFMGMDNIPRSDVGAPQADASGWMALFAKNMIDISDALGKSDRSTYYHDQFDAIANAINSKLWDDQSKFYYDCQDKGCTQWVKVKSLTGFIPLIAGVVPADRVKDVMAHLTNANEFWSNFGVRSTSADESIYEPGYASVPSINSNWRGPIWLPINYLLVQATANVDAKVSDQLRENLIKTIEAQSQIDQRFHEYYDASNGAGLGADHQTGWTALVANLIYEKYKR